VQRGWRVGDDEWIGLGLARDPEAAAMKPTYARGGDPRAARVMGTTCDGPHAEEPALSAFTRVFNALWRASRSMRSPASACGRPSRRAHASRVYPTCAVKAPISGKPEIGGRSSGRAVGRNRNACTPLRRLEAGSVALQGGELANHPERVSARRRLWAS